MSKQPLRDGQAEQIEVLRMLLAERDKEIAGAREHIEYSRQRRVRLSGQLDRTLGQVCERDKEIDHWKNAYYEECDWRTRLEHDAENAISADALTERDKTIERLNDITYELRDQRNDAERRVIERDKEIERLEGELRRDFPASTREIENLQAKLAERDKEIESLVAGRDGLRIEIAACDGLLAEHDKEIERLDVDLRRSDRRVRDLEQEWAERDKEIERLRARTADRFLFGRIEELKATLAERSFTPAEIEALLTVSGNGDGKAYFTDDLLSARSKLEKMRDE